MAYSYNEVDGEAMDNREAAIAERPYLFIRNFTYHKEAR